MAPELQEIIGKIEKNKRHEERITPRLLFNGLNCYKRTSGNCRIVDDFLNEKQLEVYPHYNDVWIDGEITLKHKAVASSKNSSDPIRRVRLLAAANNRPEYVDNSARLEDAITKMQLHNYSQLPVTNNGERGLCGYISWETIGTALAKGVDSKLVKDYKSSDIEEIPMEMPILDAIRIIHEKKFAVTLDNEKKLCGIITIADISRKFVEFTEPFVLLEEIEKHLRNLIDRGEFLLEDIKMFSENPEDITCLEDLTFGEYIRILENDSNWGKIRLPQTSKELVVKELDEIRKIRNDVMHFDPTMDNDVQGSVKRLIDVRDFLRKLTS